ncbi:MAG: SDR family NAD(P)-dependent oxidoreductase [Planctomycetes bacterium]|nr:SDR family NAD(P)-dependent oxidoreductase [Planctomycetota bacterium]
MRTIRGKRALITGAASGIGRAIAMALAREGAHLWLLDIDEPGLNIAAEELRQFGVEVATSRCDLSRPDDIGRNLSRLRESWGVIDILVNNAGVVYYGPTERMTAEQWDWLLAINLLAPIQITRELLPILKERREAHVLNVCSIAGLVAGGRTAAYHVSKFGLVGFSEALRAEYRRTGLGVSALCPGPVLTNLYRSGATGRPGRSVPTPPRWLCASEETVARRALWAIRRNRRLTLVTPLAHGLYWLKRIAPWFLDWINRLGRKRRPATGPEPQDRVARPVDVTEPEEEAERRPQIGRHALASGSAILQPGASARGLMK